MTDINFYLLRVPIDTIPYHTYASKSELILAAWKWVLAVGNDAVEICFIGRHPSNMAFPIQDPLHVTRNAMLSKTSTSP